MIEIQQIDYQFQNKYENLMKLIPKIQCHICERVPGPRAADRNRYVCQNSHHLCEECKYEKCPCGSSPGRNDPKSCFDLILAYDSTMIPFVFDVFGLPWPCQNYPRGCRKILIESELENHEINYVFRLVNCLDDLCRDNLNNSKKIIFKDLINHFENDCRMDCVFWRREPEIGPIFSPAMEVEGDKNSFVFQVNLANLSMYPSLYLTPRKIEIEEHYRAPLNDRSILIKNKLTFFAVGCLKERRFLKSHFTNNNNENCSIWVYMIGSPSEAKNYSSTITVASQDGNEIYIRKGPVFTLDDDYETVMENNSIFKIKTSFAKELMDESSKLLVQVMIHRNVDDAKF